MPLVSVIIPLYNAAPTVAATVRSVQAQTLADWECLVIDDGSTDEGPSTVRRLAGTDPRFRIIAQPNQGLAAARNTGLAHARGCSIHFLDSDDWITPAALGVLTAAAECSGAAAGAWDLRDAGGRPLGRTMPAPAPALGLDGLLDGNRIAPHSHLIAADRFLNHRFDPSLRVVEDLDLWIRLAERGLQWTAVDDLVASYRVRPGSLSKNPRLMFDTHRAVLIQAYARLAGADRTDIDLSPERLTRALRRAALFYATTAALHDPDPLKPAPCDLLLHATVSGDPSPPRLSAHDLGAAACWAFLLGLGVGPIHLLQSAPSWVHPLHGWWSQCEALGWTGPDQLQALSALAAEMTDPDAIADALLDAAAGHPRPVVIGLGQNGRILRRRAAARGITPDLRDDAAPGARPIDDPLPPGATLLVTPSDDRAILPRLPRHARTLRWADYRRASAASLAEALHAAWRDHAPSGRTTRDTQSLANR